MKQQPIVWHIKALEMSSNFGVSQFQRLQELDEQVYEAQGIGAATFACIQ